MEIVKDLKYVQLFWVEECKGLISQWTGGAVNRDLRGGLDVCLEEFMKLAPGAQWIGDPTHIGIISDEDQKWINSEWFPRFLATGVKFMAVVQPASILSKIAVNKIVSQVEGTGLTVFNCGTLQEAINWMKNVNA